MRYGPGQNPNAGARGTNSNAHMSHLRYLKSQPHLQQPKGIAARTNYKPAQQRPAGSMNIGRPNAELHAEQAALQKHAAGKWSSVKLGTSGISKALSAIGLGGAAHPLRRLEHPGRGGTMMVPFAGGGAVSRLGQRLSEFANQAEPTSRLGAAATRLNPVRAARFAEMRDPLTEGKFGLKADVAARAFGAQAKVSAAVGLPLGFYETGKLFADMHADPAFTQGPWNPEAPVKTPHWPTKAEFQSQEAKDQRVHDLLNQDAQWLVRSGQATKADAADLARWANNVNPQEWRAARVHVANTFRPPRGGWLKSP